MKISKVAIRSACDHAMKDYPRESCGFICGDEYFPVENIDLSGSDSFEVAPETIKNFIDRKDIVCFIHSHPDGPDWPSRRDMLLQVSTEIGMGIVSVYGKEGKATHTTEPFFWGGKIPRPPLIGRPFRHGVTDCYSLIRDWYLEEKQIELPEFPREWRWWITQADMYRNFYEEAGFRPLTLKEKKKPMPGDVILCKIPEHGSKESARSRDVITHGAIYLGNDWMIHHLSDGRGYSPGALSDRVRATRFVNSPTIFFGMLRRDPQLVTA